MKPWGPVTKARLAEYWKAGMPVDEITKLLRRRNTEQVKNAARRFGLGPHPNPGRSGPKVGTKKKKVLMAPTPAPGQIKFRECLSCHTSFGSRGSYERVCQPCKDKEHWKAGL